MKLEDIHDEWMKDSKIDENKLDDEILKISKLHSKYYKIYTHESLLKRKYDMDLRVLKLEKYEFYTQGHTQETKDKGWQLPPIGKILKQEAPNYVDTDPEVVGLTLKIGIQNEKVDFLESIIKSLTNRGYNIKTAVEFKKFKAGL